MFHKTHPKPGARPGTLMISEDALPPRIRVLTYSSAGHQEVEITDAQELQSHLSEEGVVWIDVQGFGDEATLHAIAEQFEIHPLAMEDVVNIPQRPKAEWYGNQLLMVARIPTMPTPEVLETSQLSIVMGEGLVITFQDQYTDRLAPVRQRIEIPTSRLRHNGADYLAYVILDTAVDASYPVLETMGEQLELIEQQIITNPHPRVLQQTNLIKNQLVNLRRTIWPQRDAVHSLLITDSEVMGELVRVYLRDTYDHSVQTAEVVEMYREMATGLVNTYLSSVAHRSNEVMKVLTIMSSIFVPLTFVAGIYGMNFEHMPELSFAWSYPLVCCTMAGIAFCMLAFFRHKGWISLVGLGGARREAGAGDGHERHRASLLQINDAGRRSPAEVPVPLRKAS